MGNRYATADSRRSEVFSSFESLAEDPLRLFVELEKRDELLHCLVLRLRGEVEVHDIGREQFSELHMSSFEGATLREFYGGVRKQ